MRLILMGGFLGAGKTTAIEEAVKYLQGQGHSVAVITNDQGNRLVDTGYLQQQADDVAQITDGCFCCNYIDLSNVLKEFAKKSPEYIFAEAVGSCTDMVATVVKPLQQQFAHISTMLTVVADASVLFRQLQQGKFIFKKQVQYIWQKQLQEADIILVSKIDKLPVQYHQPLQQLMVKKYPGKKMLFQNCKEEQAIKKWLKALDSFENKPRFSLEVDYEMYGEGEAALAWLDAELKLEGEFAVTATETFINDFKNNIQRNNWPIGHLKFLINNGEDKVKISFTSEQETKWQWAKLAECDAVAITVNARIECDPDELHRAFKTAVASFENSNTNISIDELNYFKPGYPQPVHHIMEVI